MTYEIKTKKLDETPGVGRLGRHIEHDSRSRRYAFRASDNVTLISTRHQRYVPVLDQGELGACTGYATLGALGTGRNYVGTVKTRVTGSVATLSKLAVGFYTAATKLDSVPGTYPPDDTGSTGLAVAKAAQRGGYITGYQHTFDLQSALVALQMGPIIVGTNWYSSMDSVNSKTGLVKVAGEILGGHEFCVDEINVEQKTVGITNSWGTDWGLSGRFFLAWADFERLLQEEGDVVLFTPLGTPAPIPVEPAPVTPTPAVPTPTPTPAATATVEDGLLWAAAQAWAKGKGLV